MSIIGDIEDKAKEFLLRVALKKAATKVIQIIVARVAALQLNKYGVNVNPDALTLALAGGFETLRNYLKQRFNLPL